MFIIVIILGAIAKKILKLFSNVEIIGFVKSIQEINFENIDYENLAQEMVNKFKIIINNFFRLKKVL